MYNLKETCLLFIHPYDDPHQDHDHPDAAHGGGAGGTGVDICVPGGIYTYHRIFRS